MISGKQLLEDAAIYGADLARGVFPGASTEVVEGHSLSEAKEKSSQYWLEVSFGKKLNGLMPATDMRAELNKMIKAKGWRSSGTGMGPNFFDISFYSKDEESSVIKSVEKMVTGLGVKKNDFSIKKMEKESISEGASKKKKRRRKEYVMFAPFFGRGDCCSQAAINTAPPAAQPAPSGDAAPAPSAPAPTPPA